jgi:GNAT superfamily N-acetyltransferase
VTLFQRLQEQPVQLTSESVAAKLPDDVWQVIKDHLLKYKGYEAPDDLRDKLEKNTDIELFDGGAFVAVGNEFDLFVVPEKRGKWRIRSVLKNYLDKMGRTHGKIVVRINEQNTPSLRLARGFGFKEISRENGTIRLENESWVT